MLKLPDVLIIEDQEKYSIPLKECLNTSNRYHVVAVVDNVLDACNMIMTHKPRIIFVDLQLKDGDFGLTILRYLEGKKLEPLPFRIVMSDFTNSQIMEHAKQLSDFHFFKKKVNPEKIVLFLDTLFYSSPQEEHSPFELYQTFTQRIEQILQPFHFPKHQKGYQYLLKCLIEQGQSSQKRTKDYFSLALETVAFNLESDPNTINMGIDRLIKRTFKNYNDDYLAKIYPPYQATKKAPTPKKLITYLIQQIET